MITRDTRVFVYDADRGSRDVAVRPWRSLVGAYQSLDWNGRDFGPENPMPGAVVIVHGVRAEVVTKFLTNLAANGVCIVDVTTGNREQNEATPNAIYLRAKGVGHRDPHFRSCFDRFISDLRQHGKPDFTLLEPRFPEHVLACYICALGKVPVREDWQLAFQNETEYWHRGKRLAEEYIITWADHANASRLRQFLVATQALLEHQGSLESEDSI